MNNIVLLLLPMLLLLLFLLLLLLLIIIPQQHEHAQAVQRELEVRNAAERSREAPDDLKLALEANRQRLEKYLDANLAQNDRIFRMAVFFVSIGFVFIIAGASLVMATLLIDWIDVPQGSSLMGYAPTWAFIAGIVTEFLATVVLFIYRSSLEQSSEYFKTVDRLNIIGITTMLVDKIKPDESQDQVRGDVAKMLIQYSSSVIPPSPPRAAQNPKDKES